jgi:hypothetical protein
MTVEQAAVRFYYDITKIITTKLTKVGDRYFYICRRDDDILLHTDSIVSLCHRLNPQKFCQVSNYSFRKAFPRYIKLSTESSSMSFRVIDREEFFKEIANESKSQAVVSS